MLTVRFQSRVSILYIRLVELRTTQVFFTTTILKARRPMSGIEVWVRVIDVVVPGSITTLDP